MVWKGQKDCVLIADEVCGRTKGQARYSQSSWWIDVVVELISVYNF